MDDHEMQLRGRAYPWLLQRPGELRGRHLRYLLTSLLREAGHDLTVAELVARCSREGVVFTGRASKIVSDALRWEMSWGRVIRMRRGVYRFGHVPKSTAHWIRGRVFDMRCYLARLRTPTPSTIDGSYGPPRPFLPFVT